MRLFKYCAGSRACGALTDGRLRFTQPVYFNDPFELAPSIEGAMDDASETRLIGELLAGYAANPSAGAEHYERVLEEQERATGLPLRQLFPFEQQMSTMLPQVPDIIRSLMAFVNRRIAATFYADLRERIAKSFGILSLSEIEDSLLMWAHYADEHRGVVLEFEGSHPYFNRRLHDHDVARSVRPVVYTPQRPRRAIVSYSADDGDFLDRLANDFFLVKSPEWSYEREWRMLLPARDADAVLDRDGQQILLHKYPAEALVGVTIGCRAVEATIKSVRNALARPEYGHVALRRARLHPELFQLVIGPDTDSPAG